MLHILWMILKIILIVIGILLGLVVLALLLVLFCPVRYGAKAEKASPSFKEVRLEASVSWLFGLVRAQILFQDGNLSPDIRVFGIPVLKLLKRKESGSSKKMPKPTETAEAEKAAEGEKTAEAENAGTPQDERDVRTSPVETAETQKNGPGQRAVTKERFYKRLWNKIRSVWEKIIGIPRKILELIRKIALSIRTVYDKIDWWKQFLTHPRTKAAVSLVKRKAGRVIRHVFPTRLRGRITFGSEDPSVTGTVLAVAGMTIPLHKNNIMVFPAFEGENMLEGDVWLKGRIYGIVLVKAALEIYFNKDVKYVISRWKKHKEG